MSASEAAEMIMRVDSIVKCAPRDRQENGSAWEIFKLFNKNKFSIFKEKSYKNNSVLISPVIFERGHDKRKRF